MQCSCVEALLILKSAVLSFRTAGQIGGKGSVVLGNGWVVLCPPSLCWAKTHGGCQQAWKGI